jgi:hypothetical protein
MSIKYNERGEVISVNGLTTGHFLGTPMQDALGTKEENSAYGTELKTVTRNENTVEDGQPKAAYTADEWLNSEVTELESNVTNIPTHKFYCDKGLEKVSLPNVVSIGSYAFTNCSNLVEVNAPLISEVNEQTFAGCTSLKKFDFSNVTTVSGESFRSCRSLETIHAPNLTEIRSGYAFERCAELITVDLPNLTRIVSSSTFANCGKLTHANLPKLQELPLITFSGCGRLTSVNAPELTKVEKSSFASTGLVELNMPKVTSIGDYAIQECFKLKKITAPLLTTLGNAAFADDDKLEFVDIGFATTIGNSVFKNCKNLSTLILRANSVVTYTARMQSGSFLNKQGSVVPNVYVPSTLVEQYKASTTWGSTTANFLAIEDYPEICGTTE